MALTATNPRLIKTVGETTELVVGAVDATGTSTVVTVPQLSVVQGVICTGATSTTVIYVATVSGNTFTATHADGDDFYYMAWGKAKI